MAEPETKKKTSSTSIMPDWSQLLEELLYLISTHLENCFDVVHARSVCRSWRSTFPFPSSLLRQSYSLPSFPLETNDLCTLTLEKVPSFLFCRVLTPSASTSEFFLGRIRGYESEDHMELPSPLQCSMKVKIPGSDQTLLNMLDCQIISLGHQYRIKGRDFRRVAVLPLESGKFVVLLITYRNSLLVLTSAEMRWMPLENVPNALCSDLVTFRGRFYAIFYMQPRFYASKIVVIDPYSLEVTLLLPPPSEPTLTLYHLVPSGNDELFLVEMIFQTVGGLDISQSKCKVSRLDEAGTWVKVSDLGDRVWFIGKLGIFSCSAKELPHGCGLSGNSILFTNVPGNVNFSYKYGVHRGDAEDDLSCLRISTDNRVMMLNKSFPVVAFRVDDTYIISDSNADVDEGFGLRRSC